MSQRNFGATLLSLVLFFAVLIQTTTAQDKSTENKHLGTWKLVSTKYGDATDFTVRGSETMRIKIINATHFTWLEVEDASKKVISSAGGTYTLNGNIYTETIAFAGEGMETYVGKAQKFTLRIDGEKLYQSGQLSDGLKIEEIWERVK